MPLPLRDRFLRHPGRRLLLALALAVAYAAPAPAATNQIAMMMDDNLLIYGTDQERTASLYFMKSIGVDAVRVTVNWNFLAGPVTSTPLKRRRFVADPPPPTRR